MIWRGARVVVGLMLLALLAGLGGLVGLFIYFGSDARIIYILHTFRATYGPLHKTFAALPSDGQRKLEAELLQLARESNRDGATLVAPAAYLEAVIVRK